MNAADRTALADTILSLELGLDRLKSALAEHDAREGTPSAEAILAAGRYHNRDRWPAILGALEVACYPTTREWLELAEDVLSLVESGRGDHLVTIPGGVPAPASVLLETLGLESLTIRPPTSAEREIVRRAVEEADGIIRRAHALADEPVHPEELEESIRVAADRESDLLEPPALRITPVCIGDVVERRSALSSSWGRERAIPGLVVAAAPRRAQDPRAYVVRWGRWESGEESTVAANRLRIIATTAELRAIGKLPPNVDREG